MRPSVAYLTIGADERFVGHKTIKVLRLGTCCPVEIQGRWMEEKVTEKMLGLGCRSVQESNFQHNFTN